MQAARGLVGFARELAARVQRAEDHLECRFFRKLGVRIDRNAAPVVAHEARAVLQDLHLNAVGMARDRLVHRVVENLGHHVMQRALVGAANIHAGAFSDGFEPFEHLDRGGVVI